jgi:hypothetical protein
MHARTPVLGVFLSYRAERGEALPYRTPARLTFMLFRDG